jgi:hypothetical protein
MSNDEYDGMDEEDEDDSKLNERSLKISVVPSFASLSVGRMPCPRFFTATLTLQHLSPPNRRP